MQEVMVREGLFLNSFNHLTIMTCIIPESAGCYPLYINYCIAIKKEAIGKLWK